MSQRRWRWGWVFLFMAASAEPQTANEVLASWVALDAPLGHEHFATDLLLESLPGWQRDRSGNLIRRVGSGAPRRVVACGLDWHGYVISQIRDDGYLRLHRIGRGPGHPLWDQAHEGQQVRILTRSGPLVGVTAVANGHFASQHRRETDVTTADDLWLDVGAESDGDVTSMGIRLLDPVLRHLPPWSYGGEVAGPGVGARIGCAAVAAVARAEVPSGETVFLMTTQHLFGWVGLGGALMRLGPVDEVTLVGAGEPVRRDERVDIDAQPQLGPVLRRAGVETLRLIAPAVSDAGALVERTTLVEADALEAAVRASAGAREGEVSVRIAAPERTGVRSPAAGGSDEVDVATLLARLAEIGATPGHETPVQSVVVSEMPEWARDASRVDELGNLWLTMGPSDSNSLADVFIAHMDEVGYEIETIAPSGVMELRRRGGTVASAWEGQPAKLQLESGDELKGVFLTRDAAEQRRPEQMSAWFGMDATELETRGVRLGLGITGYKEAHRLGAHRFTARSLDDRAGTTALLTALKRIDPSALERPVVFAWSVQEEGGLVGAGALAQRLATETRQVFSVDTFVSSDTPLESPHFAYAPLGDGPVLRAIENSSLAPLTERERVQALARSAGIPLQLGLTQGGTDGTRFTFWGAPNAGLSWPGRYSHSPAEVLDLRDLVGLHHLIRLLVESSLH